MSSEARPETLYLEFAAGKWAASLAGPWWGRPGGGLVGGRRSHPATGALASVFSRTTAGPGPAATRPRRPVLPGPVSTARAPARDAAPLGPAQIPATVRSAIARRAAASLTATAASSPPRRDGQAIAEAAPHVSPPMIGPAGGTGPGACP